MITFGQCFDQSYFGQYYHMPSSYAYDTIYTMIPYPSTSHITKSRPMLNGYFRRTVPPLDLWTACFDRNTTSALHIHRQRLPDMVTKLCLAINAALACATDISSSCSFLLATRSVLQVVPRSFLLYCVQLNLDSNVTVHISMSVSPVGATSEMPFV